MNCTTANEISIEEFLLTKGISPKNQNSRNSWYFSPLHNEKTASFKVDQVRNLWYDFGTGTGGRLIDLVRQLFRVDVPGALQIISGSDITPQSFSFDKQKEKTVTPIEIKNIQSLKNEALIQYFESRCIPFKIASNHTKEAYYSVTKPDTGEIKKYFAIAFENDESGFELRNKIWKGGTSPKTITTIPGKPEKLNVFEGFMDFLSALVHFRQTKPQNTTIVLNSVSNLAKIWEILPKFNQVNLFLDNDHSGEKATNEIQSRFPESINQALIIYPGHKDFNDFICNHPKP